MEIALFIRRKIRKLASLFLISKLSGPSDKKSILTINYLSGDYYAIGDHTYGKPKVLFPNPNAILTIGKFCSIAENVTIFLGGNHRTHWITTYPFNSLWRESFGHIADFDPYSATKGSVTIGHDVWLGYNSIILSGITIGNGSVVAAGSVVTKDIGPYEIWGGNPAKFIRKRFTESQITKLEKIQWWNWEESKIRANLGNLCDDNIEEFINSHGR